MCTSIIHPQCWQMMRVYSYVPLCVCVAEERADWHLDNVMVLANETLPSTLHHMSNDVDSLSHVWFLHEGASFQPACDRNTSVMLFSGPTGTYFQVIYEFCEFIISLFLYHSFASDSLTNKVLIK